jgi:hypothetical protein
MSEPYDAGNPEHVRNAKKTAKILQQKMQNGFVKICDDPDTRFVLNEFFKIVGPLRDAFTPDPYQHAHNAGWKSAGNWWFEKALLHDPDILRKIAIDDGSLLNTGSQDDGHNNNSDSSSE